MNTPRRTRLALLTALTALAVLTLLATACTADAGSSGSTPTGTPSTPPATTTPSTGGATATPAPAGTALPTPGAATPTGVFIDSADVLLLESYPVQVVLHVTGSLPTPCHAITHDVIDDGASIRVALTAHSGSRSCAQVLAPFEERIALGSYASGSRTVLVNGDQVGEFDLGSGGGDVSAAPGRPFALSPGETATLEDDGTRIRFDGVENDSRCPRDVQCVRAGDATVRLTVTLATGAEQTVRVLVDPSEGEASVGGLSIQVTALEPTPVSTSTIAPDAYMATLVVHRE